MNSHENHQQNPEFQLKDKKGKLINIKSRHWEAQGVYLNDICLIADLKPYNNGEPEDIKEDLYSLLMAINQTALEHNLMRPVIGVISEADLSNQKLEVHQWGSDQDWHRGAFTLFIEKDSAAVKRRLNDLKTLNVRTFEPGKREESDDQSISFRFTSFSGPRDGEDTVVRKALIGMETTLNFIIDLINKAPQNRDELLKQLGEKVKSTAEQIAKGEYHG